MKKDLDLLEKACYNIINKSPTTLEKEEREATMTTSLNATFFAVTNFRDLCDVFNAHYPQLRITRNDLQRAVRILHLCHITGRRVFSATYRELNISQSSEAQFRSKLGKIFRTLGCLDNRRGGVRLLNDDIYGCTIALSDVRIDDETANFLRRINATIGYEYNGRSQDRVASRHNIGHRERHVIPWGRESMASVVRYNQADSCNPSLVIDFGDFNPFEGCDIDDLVAVAAIRNDR